MDLFRSLIGACEADGLDHVVDEAVRRPRRTRLHGTSCRCGLECDVRAEDHAIERSQ
jgi:hypothetical protein